ncbi:alpha/beta hydrolase [Hymenobacter sp. BT507]|uniref:Alpha/beta hydrolase n=1 Tax=Hymenobacter citatus TaxID=2763506 RepID=A0ABR7MP92_9BACT|nr:alpha/beta hydrolase [Hymenobacter citatus]MBC6612783.1 alpha/beta hydrolase [Hymenobacter citatus]
MSALRTRIVEANGLTMQFTEQEQGEGPLVILCHGFPETSYAWRHQLPALAAAGFHAVAPDMRGYGGTTRPESSDQYTLLQLVGDLVGLLDALSVEQAVVVGNDWGATVAWHAALLRPDRFRAVVALGVPMMGQPPVAPTRLFPQTEEALHYTLYFQQPGLAEAEFERQVPQTLRKILFAASGEAGPRQPGDGTPTPFGMVSRQQGLLPPLPEPVTLPSWLTEADLDTYAAAFAASGFAGGLSYYRNLDRNRELLAPFHGLPVQVPALFLIGQRDVGLSIPGMREIIATMPSLVPQLRPVLEVLNAGHWLQQERPEEVNTALIAFLQSL